jgi:Domain of unknown function (DUF6457)
VTTLDIWVAAVCAELELDPAAVDIRQVLDLARDVAHQVERPAAPVTSYLLGLAAGAGQPAPEAAARISALAAGWPSAPHGRDQAN